MDTLARFEWGDDAVQGTINGAGLYHCMLWAGDKSPDTFRIRITEVAGGIVYDDGPGDSVAA